MAICCAWGQGAHDGRTSGRSDGYWQTWRRLTYSIHKYKPEVDKTFTYTNLLAEQNTNIKITNVSLFQHYCTSIVLKCYTFTNSLISSFFADCFTAFSKYCVQILCTANSCHISLVVMEIAVMCFDNPSLLFIIHYVHFSEFNMN